MESTFRDLFVLSKDQHHLTTRNQLFCCPNSWKSELLPGVFWIWAAEPQTSGRVLSFLGILTSESMFQAREQKLSGTLTTFRFLTMTSMWCSRMPFSNTSTIRSSLSRKSLAF